MSLNVLIIRVALAVIRSAGHHATLTSPNPAPTAIERGKYYAIRADGRPKSGWDGMVPQAAAFMKVFLRTFGDHGGLLAHDWFRYRSIRSLPSSSSLFYLPLPTLPLSYSTSRLRSSTPNPASRQLSALS